MTMKKVLLGMFLLICFSIKTQAQVSIKVGASLSTVAEEKENVTKDQLKNESVLGTVVGLAFELNPGKLLVFQPELLFSQSGGRNSYELLGTKTDTRYKINYLELPLLAKLQLGNNNGEGVGIHIAAGPWLGYALGGKTKTATTIGSSQEVITERKFTFDDEDDARRINYGLVGAAGIGFGKVTLDLRYNYGLNNILDNDADNSNDNRPVLQTRGVALTMALRL